MADDQQAPPEPSSAAPALESSSLRSDGPPIRSPARSRSPTGHFGAPRDKSATRERILGAAADQFARYGFAHATVRHIANQAGVSHATIHWHFGSKSTVYGEAVRTAGERFMETVRESGLAALPFLDAANAWIRQLAEDTPVACLLRSLAADHGHPTVEETAKSVNGVFCDFWRDWLREHHLQDRRQSAVATDLAQAIVAALAGMAVVRFHGEPQPAVASLIALVRLIDRP